MSILFWNTKRFKHGGLFGVLEGIRLRSVIFARHIIRGVDQKVRAERIAEPAEGSVPTATAFARGVQCNRMEMAANIRVSFQLYGAGSGSKTGRRQNV